MQEYPKALFHYEKALEIRLKTLPVCHPDVGTSYNNIGVLYDNVHEYPKALITKKHLTSDKKLFLRIILT